MRTIRRLPLGFCAFRENLAVIPSSQRALQIDPLTRARTRARIAPAAWSSQHRRGIARHLRVVRVAPKSQQTSAKRGNSEQTGYEEKT
jgi:hypothetical protein